VSWIVEKKVLNQTRGSIKLLKKPWTRIGGSFKFIFFKKWKPRLEVLLKSENRPTFVWSWCSTQDWFVILVWTPCLMHRCVCVFDGTYYKITITNYIFKTSLYMTFCMYLWGPWPLKILMFAPLVTREIATYNWPWE